MSLGEKNWRDWWGKGVPSDQFEMHGHLEGSITP